MGSSKDFLKSFAFSNAKFLKVPNGSEVTGKFLGADPYTAEFNGRQIKSVKYRLEVDGEERWLISSSKGLAKDMVDVDAGCVINIKRLGEQGETVYVVTPIET